MGRLPHAYLVFYFSQKEVRYVNESIINDNTTHDPEDYEAIHDHLADEDDIYNESYIISKKNYEINMDKWKPGTPLWITGSSGDGKSTYANQLAKEKKAFLVPLDLFLVRIAKPKEKYDKFLNDTSGTVISNGSQMILDYINKHPELPWTDPNTKGNWGARGQDSALWNGLFDWLIDASAKNPKYKNKLIIFEGCNICLMPVEKAIKFPFIIMGTSRLDSSLRRIKRDRKEHDDYSIFKIIYREFKRSTNGSIADLNKAKDNFEKGLKKQMKTINESYVIQESQQLIQRNLSKLDYDPKTQTVDSHIKDAKTGKNFRIRLIVDDNHPVFKEIWETRKSRSPAVARYAKEYAIGENKDCDKFIANSAVIAKSRLVNMRNNASVAIVNHEIGHIIDKIHLIWPERLTPEDVQKFNKLKAAAKEVLDNTDWSTLTKHDRAVEEPIADAFASDYVSTHALRQAMKTSKRGRNMEYAELKQLRKEYEKLRRKFPLEEQKKIEAEIDDLENKMSPLIAKRNELEEDDWDNTGKHDAEMDEIQKQLGPLYEKINDLRRNELRKFDKVRMKELEMQKNRKEHHTPQKSDNRNDMTKKIQAKMNQESCLIMDNEEFFMEDFKQDMRKVKVVDNRKAGTSMMNKYKEVLKQYRDQEWKSGRNRLIIYKAPDYIDKNISIDIDAYTVAYEYLDNLAKKLHEYDKNNDINHLKSTRNQLFSLAFGTSSDKVEQRCVTVMRDKVRISLMVSNPSYRKIDLKRYHLFIHRSTINNLKTIIPSMNSSGGSNTNNTSDEFSMRLYRDSVVHFWAFEKTDDPKKIARQIKDMNARGSDFGREFYLYEPKPNDVFYIDGNYTVTDDTHDDDDDGKYSSFHRELVPVTIVTKTPLPVKHVTLDEIKKIIGYNKGDIEKHFDNISDANYYSEKINREAPKSLSLEELLRRREAGERTEEYSSYDPSTNSSDRRRYTTSSDSASVNKSKEQSNAGAPVQAISNNKLSSLLANKKKSASVQESCLIMDNDEFFMEASKNPDVKARKRTVKNLRRIGVERAHEVDNKKMIDKLERQLADLFKRYRNGEISFSDYYDAKEPLKKQIRKLEEGIDIEITDSYGKKHKTKLSSNNQSSDSYWEPHDIINITPETMKSNHFDSTFNHEAGHTEQAKRIGFDNLKQRDYTVSDKDDYIIKCAKLFLQKNVDKMNSHDNMWTELHADILSCKKSGYGKMIKDVYSFKKSKTELEKAIDDCIKHDEEYRKKIENDYISFRDENGEKQIASQKDVDECIALYEEMQAKLDHSFEILDKRYEAIEHQKFFGPLDMSKEYKTKLNKIYERVKEKRDKLYSEKNKLKRKFEHKGITAKDAENYNKCMEMHLKYFAEELADLKAGFTSYDYRIKFMEDMKHIHEGHPGRCSMKYPPMTPEDKKYMQEFTVDPEEYDETLHDHIDDEDDIYNESSVLKFPKKVNNVPFDIMYFGSNIDFGNESIKLDHNELFLTPYIGLASIFITDRKEYFKSLPKDRPHNTNIGYDEWGLSPEELQKPLKEVHVSLDDIPNVTPFEFDCTGFIYAVDVSQYKDNLYQKDWMTADREYILKDINPVPIKEKIEWTHHVYVRGGNNTDGVFNESWTDFKNGVHPSSGLMFHVSLKNDMDGKTINPQLPSYITDGGELDDNYQEDTKTKRLCVSPSIEGCLIAILNYNKIREHVGDKFYVYTPEKPFSQYKHKTNKEIVKDKLVFDANITKEAWILEPCKLKLYGIIKLKKVKDLKKKPTVEKNIKMNTIKLDYEWIMTPKASGKFNKAIGDSPDKEDTKEKPINEYAVPGSFYHDIKPHPGGVYASPVDDNFFIEAVLKAKDRNALKDSEFGIPELRKYPLTDETHINMAVKFFGKAPKKYKLSLAKRILRSAHSHDMDTDGWDTINDYIKNHKESTVTEGFVDKNIKYTLAGIKIPKLGPVDEKYLMDHKSDYAQLKNSGYIDLHDNNFQRLFNDKADELYEPLDNLFQHIGYAKDFNIYNKYRLLLCKLFDLPTNHVIGLEGFYSGNLGQLRLKEEEDSNGTPLKPNDVLYHTSKHKGITELQPSFVSRKTKTIRRMPGQNLLSIEALYTTPRVYVGLNTPVSRLGGHGSVSISDNTRIYKIIGFKGSVKEDKELHGAARFIETKSPVKVVDVTDEYLSKHIKESVVQEAAYKKGINKANVHPVMIVYKRFSTKKKAQLVPIGKMWDIANKYFPNSTDLSGFGWDWTGWETDFAYGIIINNKQLPDGFMDELKKEFPDIKLDKNFLIPKTYEETYDCTESNMNEVYDKIWAKGFLECELEEYPAEGKMKISVIYQKDKAKLENEVSKHIKEASTIQEGFFEVGFGNLRKTIADKLGKFVTVTNVQNPTGKEAKFVIKSNEHPEDYVNVIAMGNGVKAYGYKDSERVSIFNNASLSAAIQKLIDSVCDLFDIQKPINESYTERKNFIMKEQITKILEAYNSGVLTQEEASTKIESIQESYTPNSDAENNKAEEVMESAIMNNLRAKQEKIMESYKMGIINGTEGMRLIERVMMEADYITEEEDTAYEGDDNDQDITPADTDGDTSDSDDSNIESLADYINSLDASERADLLAKINTDVATAGDADSSDDIENTDDATADDLTPPDGETEEPTSDGDTDAEPEVETESAKTIKEPDERLINAYKNVSLDDMEV